MGGERRRHRWTAAIGATALITALALAGCGANDSSDEGSTSSGGAAPAGVVDRDQSVDGGATEDGAEQPAGAGAGADLRVDQRSIIYTGSITVRVAEGQTVSQTAARATAIVTGAGGFVGGDQRSSGSGYDEATLQLRVPAGKFTAVLDQLAGLGEEEQRGIETQDVTEETIDLDARIATQRARVESGRRLLAQADDLADLVLLEGELAKREADLASLEAKKRRLADLTALSTITAVFLDRGAAAPNGDDDPAGFLGGLKAGWTALVASLAVLLTVLGALLPWLLAFGLPVLAVLMILRRSRRRAGPPTGTPAPASAAASAD